MIGIFEEVSFFSDDVDNVEMYAGLLIFPATADAATTAKIIKRVY